MDKEKRLQSEKEFHNETFSKNTRQAVKKYYRSANKSKAKYQELILREVKGKNVLEYGCGPGSAAFDLARSGANVTAIDISNVAIELAQEHAQKEELQISFHIMNAEDLKFENDFFDLICGSGILHHLSLEDSYKEINRTLREDGKAIFFEPMGHNPIINLYRNLTPKLRTPDEHPLLLKDIELAKKYFKNIERFHFNLIATAAAFIPAISNILHETDCFLFNTFESLKKHSWIVILEFSLPKK